MKLDWTHFAKCLQHDVVEEKIELKGMERIRMMICKKEKVHGNKSRSTGSESMEAEVCKEKIVKMNKK